MPTCLHGWGSDGINPSGCPECDRMGREQDKKTLSLLGFAPYDATGHAETCDRVKPMRLPAYYLLANGTCAHCGNALAWPEKK
jgi:hypothetical protein